MGIERDPPSVLVMPKDGAALSVARRSVESAAREIAVASKRIPVDPDALGWVCGKGSQSLHFLQALSGALYVKTQKDGIDVFGTPAQLEAFRLAVETHLSYRDVFSKLIEKDKELDAELAEWGAPRTRRR